MAEFNLGGGRILELDFATDSDERRVWQWNSTGGLVLGNPKVRDALELSELALIRWNEAKAKLRNAGDLQDMKDRIRDEGEGEVSGLLVAKPLWAERRQLAVLGLCYFRRTWCNNFVLDYLTIHPQSPIGHRERPRRRCIPFVASALPCSTTWVEKPWGANQGMLKSKELT